MLMIDQPDEQTLIRNLSNANARLTKALTALTAERDAERALADELTSAGGLVAELLAQWQMGIFHGCLPSGVQASVPGVLKRWYAALARHSAARREG